jgi:hypothetical protein
MGIMYKKCILKLTNINKEYGEINTSGNMADFIDNILKLLKRRNGIKKLRVLFDKFE